MNMCGTSTSSSNVVVLFEAALILIAPRAFVK